MKIKFNNVPIEFCKTVLSVAKELSPGAKLFWARNEEKLTEILEIKDFEPITSIPKEEPYIIPSIPETNRSQLWKKRIIERNYFPEFIEKINKKQPTTIPACVHSFQMNVSLFREELFCEIGDADDLINSAFSLSQICLLKARHQGNHKEVKPLLDYNQPNYFPIVQADGKLIFISLHSKQPWLKHSRWMGWFKEEENKFFDKGVLFLKEDIPDLL